MSRPTVGSLFAGIGGFDLGFERAGYDVKWCVERDRAAQAVLRTRFPNAKIYEDIREVDPWSLERVDVVCGGFPCQDLSVAGKRAGLAGERSGLFHEAMRIVRWLCPELVILENVPGLLSSNRGLDFATVLSEVDEGWPCAEVGWRILDSRYFGVAQRRRRVFVAASPARGRAEHVLALSEGCKWHPSQGDSERPEDSEDPDGCLDGRSISPAVSSKWHKGTGGPSGDECQNMTVFRKSRRAQSTSDFETWVKDDTTNTLNAFDVGDARTTQVVVPTDVYNLAVGSDTSASLTTSTGNSTGSGPKVIDDLIIRRLTPLECERLQGFPDGWTDVEGASDSRRYKQLGNAVTVNVAEWLARRSLNGGRHER